jgi:protein-S-isoprenylcysteine O-methyltransferase Ste14
MSGIKEAVFRHRENIAIVFLLAALACRWHGGMTLGLREPAEDCLDALGCLILALGHGLRVLALRHIGPDSRTHLLGAKRLVTDGPYAVVRNPLYLGNWLIAVGLCVIAQLGWLLVAGPLLAFLLYYMAALAEEQNLLRQHGEAYTRYCEATSRFLPRLLVTRSGWRILLNGSGRYPVLRTKEYQAFMSSAACVLLFELIERVHHRGGLW